MKTAKKEKQAPGFMMYLDNVGIVDCLTDEQAGKLWKMLFSYAINGEVPDIDDTVVKMGFNIMSKQIDRDKIKYIEKCEKNSENAKKRWDNSNADKCERIQTNTDEYNGMQANANYANNNTISTTTQPNLISTSTIPPKSNINVQEQREKEEKGGLGEKEGKTQKNFPNEIFLSLPTTEGDYVVSAEMYKQFKNTYTDVDIDTIFHKLKTLCKINSMTTDDVESYIAEQLVKQLSTGND